MNGFPDAFPSPRDPLWRRIAVLVLAALAATTAAADGGAIEDGARFEIRSAFLEPAEHVYQLNAVVNLALSRSAELALREGVPVLFELDVSVDRKRRYLPDVQVGSIALRWQIHYHALSERYLVNNLNSGQQTSFASLAAALAGLSEVRGLPVIDEALLEHGGRFEASVRAMAAIESGLPNALRAMMFWVDWKRSTDWYSWTVRP